MLRSVEHDQARPDLCEASRVTTFTYLEELIERELSCRFLPLIMKFFVTSNSTLHRSSNSDASVHVAVVIMYDANGSVNALLKCV